MRLHSLLEQLVAAGQPVRAADLATRLHISTRTLQSDVAYLRVAGSEHGFRIVTKRGQGISIEIVDADALQAFMDFVGQDTHANPTSRVDAILQIIVLHGGFVSTEEVAEELSLGRSTVLSELASVAVRAELFQLRLERARHYGVRVTGPSYQLKEYLAQASLDESSIVHAAFSSYERGLAEVGHALTDALNAEGLGINWHEFGLLKAFIMATAYLCEGKGEDVVSLEADFDVLEAASDVASVEEDRTVDERLARVCAAAMEAAERSFDVSFSSEDHEDLADELAAYARYADGAEVRPEDIREGVERFLAKTDERLGTTYLSDGVLLDMLQTHVMLLVNRLLHKVSCRNPYAREIGLTKSSSTDVAILLADRLSERYGVTPSSDEIGFVAMHFAAHDERVRQNRLHDFAKIVVVCSTGGGAAMLVKMQLESIFPGAEVSALSYLEQDKIAALDPDLLFTMVPLAESHGIPTIYIREVLSEGDLVRIRELVQRPDFRSASLVESDNSIWRLFSPTLFARVVASDYHELINDMARQLVERGYATEAFPSLVSQRERFASTVYLNGICVPHPVEAAGVTDAISVRVLERPFVWMGREVRIVFMICLMPGHVDRYRPITRLLYTLMRKPNCVARLQSCASVTELISQMKEGAEHE